MHSRLAMLAIVVLGFASPFALVACGGGTKTVTTQVTQAAAPTQTQAQTTSTATTVTTPTTVTTATGPSGGGTTTDCCSGPGGGYAGCSMQHPPNCQ